MKKSESIEDLDEMGTETSTKIEPRIGQLKNEEQDIKRDEDELLDDTNEPKDQPEN